MRPNHLLVAPPSRAKHTFGIAIFDRKVTVMRTNKRLGEFSQSVWASGSHSHSVWLIFDVHQSLERMKLFFIC
ncbi:hypothetical protein AN416_26625 [Paraburkholderia caribensis]|nr:hypothetical protein AN416_26625 [Paraburkholderia caribensis]